jgi:hypothetical protein
MLRFVVAAGACLVIPLSMHVSAILSLSVLMILFVGLAGFETVRSDFRQTVRDG